MDEQQRLKTLESLRVLDTAPEPFFDAIVEIASAVSGQPISLISLIDEDRQWFKANHGLDGVTQTPRDIAFCTYAIEDDDVFEVRDATEDPRFASNPLVISEPAIRHYAGAPITIDGTERIGTLCVISDRPGELDDRQKRILTLLARAVGEGLEQRAVLLGQIDAANRLQQRLRDSEDFLERTNRAAKVGGWELDLDRQTLNWTRETKNIHRVPPDYVPDLETALAFYPPESRDVISQAVQRCADDGTPWDLQLPMHRADGTRLWAHCVGHRQIVDGGTRLIGAIQDISDQHAALDALEESEARYRRLFHFSLGLICTHDLRGVLTSINPAATRSLGYEESDMVGRNLAELMRPERRHAYREYLTRIQQNISDSGVLELMAADGSYRYWAYHNVLDNLSHVPYVLGHAQDITTQYHQEQQLLEMSVRDPLTACFNRRYLGKVSDGDGAQWGCIVFDLDGFKGVNDTFGHARGDEVLIAFAAFLNAGLQQDEVAIRLGGDEFLVFVPSATEQRMQDLQTHYVEARASAPIGFTHGAALRQDQEPIDDTINRADAALYRERARVRSSPRQR